MMPVVRINDATFSDLSTLKTWFGTKTPSETIDRLVREMMEQLGMEREPAEGRTTSNDAPPQLSSTPGLTFTKPLAASINGNELHRPTWSAILIATISQVRKKGVDGERLVQELGIPAKARPYDKEGFKFLPELGISVQGQAAPECWKEVDRLAKKWRIPVSVEFQWRDNPKAQHPGQRGVLHSGNA
ncbi:T4SS efffector SepA family protein [Xanthobacter aminoxidans]|uniref:T4SS efffector SepA family protein n=1 Tax=Xanthobacter aminoxidans TaxID=186280 RepID=UPI002022CCB5|nr:hypothetical protein [Xanthobacter aminoxidans]MCL8380621.1 hypothetical protein [Xanthobacter aminoxidans]